MMNHLQKSARTSYSPGSPGVPADPGQPALPARWAQVAAHVCSYGINTQAMLAAGWTRIFIPAHGTTPSSYSWFPPLGQSNAQIIYGETCSDVITTEWVPAQPYRAPTAGKPAVPAQTIIDNLLGWNSRARSRSQFPNYGVVSFTVPRSAIGVVVGLNDISSTSGYADIRFAFYFSHGIASVMESGVNVHYIGAYNTGDVFSVTRLRGTIYYKINGTTVYSSSNTNVPLFLDAALYSGGDSVDSPTLTAWAGSDASLQPLASIGGAGTAYSGSSASILPFTGSGRVGSRSNGSLLPLVGIGSDFNYGESSGSILPFAGYAEGGLLSPGHAVGSGVAMFFTGSGSGKTGEIGHSAGSLSPFIGIGSHGSYSMSSGALLPINGFASATEGNNNATVFSLVLASGTMDAPVELFVTFNSSGTISSIFALGVTVPASMISSATASSTYALQAVLNALMYSNANGNSVVPMEDQAQEVWVVNTDTMASSRYENYAFNSFAKIGGKHYGAKSDGIYLLEGDDDAGIPVQSMMSFGKREFGNSLLKRVTNCYLGVASTGKVFLKVLYEGESFIYATRDSNENMQIQRVDIGRGIRANYLEFELYNADGDDFELASVEFSVVSLSRRI